MHNNGMMSGFNHTPNGNITPIDQIAEDTEDSPTRPAGAALNNDMGNGLLANQDI